MSRLLAVSPLAETFGGEVTLIRTLPVLAERGWRIRLAVPGEGSLRRAARERGIATARLPLGPPQRRTIASYAGAPVGLALAARSDVAFLNGLPGQRLVPSLRLARRRAVVRVNNPLPVPPRAWSRPGFWKVVAAILADSEHTARECLAAGAPEDRVSVALPPAWEGHGPPGRAGGHEGLLVGFAGRLEPRKGVLGLIEAASEFLAGRPAARLVVAGSGDEDYEQRLRDAMREGGVPDRIEMIGQLDDAAAWIRGLDVLAVPSVEEPFGTVAAEAAAAGVPVVASDVGGLREVVVDGQSGILVQSGNVGALAAAIGALLDDAERRRSLGERALELAGRFSPQAYADAIEVALQKALDAPLPSGAE